MHLRPSRILDAALLEVRSARRQARFWTLVFILCLCSFVGYALSCFYLGSVAPVSPSHGAGTPLYLLENIEPTFFLMFQAAVLFLIFDSAHQHTRNRIEETLNTNPVSNLEYLAGRVLGIAGLVWLIVVVNVITIQVFGLVASLTDFDFGGTLQIHSVANLVFLDAPSTLVFWGAFTVFLSQALRFRLLVVATGFATLIGWFLLVLEVPYSLLEVVSPSSNDTLFVSDLIPEFASWSSIAIRLATLFLAGSLVLLASALTHRRDTTKLPVSLSAAGMLLLVSATSFSFATSHVVKQFNTPEEWAETHAEYNWNHHIDIRSMSGIVSIDPRNRMEIDLKLIFDVVDDPPATWVFTLNPAMTIEVLTLDGSTTNYTHENGLLEIENHGDSSASNSHSLSIVASGVPDPRFAYFDGYVDYITDSEIQRQAVSLFGRDGSVFHPNFVALLPGAYWYPQPGVVDNGYRKIQGGTDYFDVDLSVELSARDWTVVSTGVSTATNEAGTFHVKPSSPVSEIGLLASDFRSESFKIGELEFSLHLHKLHSRNLPLLTIVEEAFRTEIGVLLDSLSLENLEIVHKSLAFVEVPRRLRTVAGGWRMDSVDNLPGLVLVKEHGFPSARFERLFKRIDKIESESDHRNETQLDILDNYFQMGLASDNPWESLPKRLWTDATSATGEFSQILDQITLSLVSSITRDELRPFSIYWATNTLDMTQVSIFGAVMGLEGVIESDDLLNRGVWRSLHRLEDDYLTRISTWNNATSIALSELPTSIGNQQDFELLMLKCSAIAEALLAANGTDKILSWLGAVRKQYSGQNFTYTNFLDIAHEQEVTVDPFLTDWIRTAKLPGYTASSMVVTRMKDDSNGAPQYQTSLQVRNTEDVAGFVRLRYPNERTQGWSYPILTSSKAIRVDGHSSKRINLVTGYEPSMVYLDPGFSLNRNEIALTRSSASVEERLDSAPSPFEENSSWIPSDEQGIIVDDLDPGFVVFQSKPSVKPSTRVGPVGWFDEPKLEGELDNGLPFDSDNFYMFEYRWKPGIWHRQSVESAFGKYRRTVATVRIRRGLEIPLAVFGAQIPESGRWRLDYHFPNFGERRWMENGEYELNIADDTVSNSASIKSADLKRGWQEIGVFDLNAGTVRVEFVGGSEIWIAILDAIRWTRAE